MNLQIVTNKNKINDEYIVDNRIPGNLSLKTIYDKGHSWNFMAVGGVFFKV